jgi:hypothetical protein
MLPIVTAKPFKAAFFKKKPGFCRHYAKSRNYTAHFAKYAAQDKEEK